MPVLKYFEADVTILGFHIPTVGFLVVKDPNTVLESQHSTQSPRVIGCNLIWLGCEEFGNVFGFEAFKTFTCPKEVHPLVFAQMCTLYHQGKVIGTVYRNYHRPALITIFIFPDLLPKILWTSSQERACPTQTCACLVKHYSKWPIGISRLNLVPAAPKLYKVAFHHVLVGIPTYKVTTMVLVLNSTESTTAYTSSHSLRNLYLVDSEDHRHIVIGLM